MRKTGPALQPALEKAFDCLDKNNNSVINPIDIIDFMKEHRTSVNIHEACQLIKEYDSDLTGELLPDEFKCFSLSAVNQALRNQVERRTQY